MIWIKPRVEDSEEGNLMLISIIIAEFSENHNFKLAIQILLKKETLLKMFRKHPTQQLRDQTF
jgi:hypothetical protein